MKLLSVNVSLPKRVPYKGKTTTGIFKEPVGDDADVEPRRGRPGGSQGPRWDLQGGLDTHNLDEVRRALRARASAAVPA